LQDQGCLRITLLFLSNYPNLSELLSAYDPFSAINDRFVQELKVVVFQQQSLSRLKRGISTRNQNGEISCQVMAARGI
jgi:hypothetical protein